MRRLLGLVLPVVLVACGSAATDETTRVAPKAPLPSEVRAPSPERRASPTTPPADDGCSIAVHTAIEPVDTHRFVLVVTASNTSSRDVVAVLTSRCPGGPATFTGLPEGYDYGALCAAGPCVDGPRSHEALVLGAGASVEVARVSLDAEADGCNARLPDGRYAIGATLDVTGARACTASRAALTLSRATPPQHTRRERTHEETPSPSPTRQSAPEHEHCPAMGCAYEPCPPGVEPPTGCAAVCGCPGGRGRGPASLF